MLRGTSSWPESGSYWPVWVAGGDFIFDQVPTDAFEAVI